MRLTTNAVKRNRCFLDMRLFTFNAFLGPYSPEPDLMPELLQLTYSSPDSAHPMASVGQHLYGNVTSSRDPDTMMLEEALRQPDHAEFIKAMHKELDDHISCKHWQVMSRTAAPRNRIPIMTVWSMKRNRNPIGKIMKWKARLCAGGH